MKKEYRDGLYLDNKIMLSDTKKKIFPVQTRLFQTLAILIGSWSTLSVFLDCIPLPAKVSSIHIAFTLCFVFAYILCLIPSYTLVKLFFCFLFYTLFFASRFKAIQNGFYILENTVIMQLEQYYQTELPRFVADKEAAVNDTTLLMIMIAIPLVSLLTVAIVRGRLIKVSFLVIMLPIAASFILGITPSEKYLVSLIAVFLYIAGTDYLSSNVFNMKQKKILHRINSWVGVWLSLISLILFFTLKLFISQDSYDDFTRIKEMKTEIQDKLSNITLESISLNNSEIKIPDLGGTKGGLDGGALHRTGKVEYTGDEHLRLFIRASGTTSSDIYYYGAESDIYTYGEHVISITAGNPVAKGLYLKGFVGSEYTGDRWIGHTKDEAVNFRKIQDKIPYNFPLNQTTDLIKAGIIENKLKNSKYQIQIDYVSANKRFLYAPYFTDYSPMGIINYNQDLYVSPSRHVDSHSFSYYNQMNMYNQDITISELRSIYYILLGEDYFDNEREYRSYVDQTYTKVPEEGLELLKAQCSAALESREFTTVEDKIAYVKNYLRMNTVYTLNPGQSPDNEDYVEYFLYKNKKGFCSHYASAAVLMLRLLKVPARYVEGYAISPADLAVNITDRLRVDIPAANFYETEVSVKDYNAHAWVEVYMNGIGWIPIEVTPPSGIGYTAYIREAATATPGITPTEKLTPTPTMEPSPTITQKPDGTKPTAIPDNTAVKSDEGQKDSFLWLPLLLIPIIIFITVKAAALWRFFKLKRADSNKKAIYYYSRMDKLLRLVCTGKKKKLRLEDDEELIKNSIDYIDKEALESFMNIIRKARYGRGLITGSELRKVISLYNWLYLGLYKRLPFVKKFILKLMLSFY